MALKIVGLSAALVCFFSLLCTVYGNDNEYFVEGHVFCDPCRVLTETKLSHKLSKATVRLECRDRESNKVMFSVEGETDENGKYKLPVTGEHVHETCDVQLVKSPDNECSDNHLHSRSRVVITKNEPLGRLANAIGFMRKTPLQDCEKMGFTPLE